MKTSRLALCSLFSIPLGFLMILISSIFAFIFLIGFAFYISAIVLGILALIAIKRQPENLKGKGISITGLVLGIVCVIFFFPILRSILF